NWALFRGNISRTGVGRGSAPYLDSVWRISSVDSDPDQTDPSQKDYALHTGTKELIEQTLHQHARRPEPILPAFLPIATAGKVIYRNFVGFAAVNIKDGKVEWQSKALASLNTLISEPNKR